MRFGQIVRETVIGVLQNRDALIRSLLVPVAGVILIELISLLPLNPGIRILLTLLESALAVLITVTINRVVLLGPASTGYRILNPWTRRETRLLFFMFGLGMIFVIPILALFLPRIPFVSLTLLALCFWLEARLILVLPVTAVDRHFSFRDSWQATRNYQWQMLGVVFLIPLTLGLPLAMIGALDYSAPLVTLLRIVPGVFVIAAVAVTFRQIELETGPGGSETGEQFETF
ncbi:MAG: hypothetical protein R3F41_13530 [Gammaproteobacteria bacterium]|nr:hypothetical protein [Pseudomonadales bacterium]MCP5349122.1 hypothetical protein [Pseudomonadales bacterium]